MPVPDGPSIRLVLLRALSSGRKLSSKLLQGEAQRYFGLTREEQREMLPNVRKTRFTQANAVALQMMMTAEEVTKTPRGDYVITQRGLDALPELGEANPATRGSKAGPEAADRRTSSPETAPQEGDGSSGTEDQFDPSPETPPFRSWRPFDPERRPATGSVRAVADPLKRSVLLEKARRDHHETLASLWYWLAGQHWTEREEQPSGIDLAATAPGGPRTIFEVKTITRANQHGQCRKALAQLLEYRLVSGSSDDHICVVVNKRLDEGRAAILRGLRVGLLIIEAGHDPIGTATATDSAI
jgi:Mrr restriction endonuclease-like protein